MVRARRIAVEAAGLDEVKTLLFQSVDQVAAARLGDDQTPRGVHGTAAYDLLPHVPGDGDHGVSVERGEQIIGSIRVFQRAVGAFCASTAPSASTGPICMRQDRRVLGLQSTRE